MGSLNKICLIGRLGKDPELRYTQTGKGVCNFSMATEETYNDVKKVEWHQVALWGKAAEAAAKYLSKGSLVYVEGKIQSREYDDKQGVKRKVWEVLAFQCTFLDSKKSDGGERSEGGYDAPDMTPASAPGRDDDIPF